MYRSLGCLLRVQVIGLITSCTGHWIDYFVYRSLDCLLGVQVIGLFTWCTGHWIVYLVYRSLDCSLLVQVIGLFRSTKYRVPTISFLLHMYALQMSMSF